MFSLLISAIDKGYLYLLKRNQYDNPTLRRVFKRRYDVEVGKYSYGCFDRWRMPGPLRIGRYCSIANSVRVVPDNHPVGALTTHPYLYEPAIGLANAAKATASPLRVDDDVWIGHNVVILPGCKLIGRGAVIGAGSIVTRDVPAYTVVAGNPAAKLYDRFDNETIAAIESSEWWLKDLDDLAKIHREAPDVFHAPTVERLKAVF